MTEVVDVIADFRVEMFDPQYPGVTDDPDDPSSESLWTDDEIKRYMTHAQDDFCRATDCIADSKTYKPTIKADNPLVKASGRIIKPRRAWLESDGRALSITTEREMEDVLSEDYGISGATNWRADDKTGPPRILVTDDEMGYYTLYPTPVEADVLRLAVYRLSKEPIYDGGDLEIPEAYRRMLLPGMKSHAYRKNDVETFDEKNALKYQNIWGIFLEKVAGEFKKRRRGPHRVRYGGI